MANYDWHDYQEQRWIDRFPEWVRGFDALRRPQPFDEVLVSLIAARQRTTTSLPRPCVFVSHRQADVDQAIRIAYLACMAGFDYWLDVLDPTLSAVNAMSGPSGLTPQQTASVVAAIIEMALLNSTHVLAVWTPNTKGSEWVPYEYGRVKDPVPVTLQAACWVHNALLASALPDYLHLGHVAKSDDEVSQWLEAEFQKRHGVLARPRTCNWPGPVPARL